MLKQHELKGLVPHLTHWLAICGVILLLGALWLARQVGMALNALFLFVVLGALVSTIVGVAALVRHRVSWSVYRRPSEHVPQLVAGASRVLTYVSCALAVELAIIPIQFLPRELSQLRMLLWGCVALAVVTALLPRRKRWSPADLLFFPLWLMVIWDLALARFDSAPDAALELAPPFTVSAYVFQGGATPLLNHHASFPQQKHALDFVIPTAQSQLHSGNAQELASYPCYGARVVAPSPGTVVDIVDDRPDMPIGETDSGAIAGNTVTLRVSDHRYVLLAHLQAGSIRVSRGQSVVAGELLGRCGNSGNTTFPHLHMQVQSHPSFSNDDPELRTFPIRFSNAKRVRLGTTSSSPFQVRRNDQLLPLTTTN